MGGSSVPLTYLDHAATTPMRPEARAAMLPWLGERFGNPSGAHAAARAARQAVDEARDVVAGALGCAPNEVIFTGGGTEADNLALQGVVAARPGTVLISAVEHHAVLHPARHLGASTVAVDGRGVLDLHALAVALKAHADTTLVSVMAANNEVGAIQPLGDVVRLVRKIRPGATVHTDAVQAAAWLDLADQAVGVDLVSVSGHKFGGPQGVGVLVARRGTPLRPQLLGGGQERELRSGTHNVAGIVGLAAALAAKTAARSAESTRVGALRDRLAAGLLAAIPDSVETAAPATGDAGSIRQEVTETVAGGRDDSAVAGRVPSIRHGLTETVARGRGDDAAFGPSARLGGHDSSGPSRVEGPKPDRAHLLPGILHLTLPGVESEALLFLLDEAGVCASAASACASGAQEASHVLAAMGVPMDTMAGALRLSLGWTTTDADVDRALEVIPEAVARLRRVATPTGVRA